MGLKIVCDDGDPKTAFPSADVQKELYDNFRFWLYRPENVCKTNKDCPNDNFKPLKCSKIKGLDGFKISNNQLDKAYITKKLYPGMTDQQFNVLIANQDGLKAQLKKKYGSGESRCEEAEHCG